MSSTLVKDPVLPRLRAALQAAYGPRLVRAVLFGSRARGDAQPDSDYDIAVFLTDMPDYWAESRKLADLRTDFIDQAGIFIDAKPYLATTLHEKTPIMHEIRKDGLDL